MSSIGENDVKKGHLFILNGNIESIACDAWLMPTNPSLIIQDTWKITKDKIMKRSLLDISSPSEEYESKWKTGKIRVRPAHSAWYDYETGNLPILVNVGGDVVNDSMNCMPIKWYIGSVIQFLRYVEELCCPSISQEGKEPGSSQSMSAIMPIDYNIQLKMEEPAYGRSRHLVLLPLVGCGKGGLREKAGELMKSLIKSVYDYIKHSDAGFDVGIVLHGKEAFAAAQKVRSVLNFNWNCLSQYMDEQAFKRLNKKAEYLAEEARNNRLALFIGAGCSAGCGLPLWGELINKISKRMKLTEVEEKALSKLNYLDSAQMLQMRLSELGNETLGELVSSQLQSNYHSLQHTLLGGGLPVDEIITTNYDNLFEKARRGANKPVTVLPTQSHLSTNNDQTTTQAEGKKGWLLKMHGDVANPDSIVLSREDYLTYDENRSGLIGVVQTMLLTKHMLFIGFSLSDYNFHKIMSAVKAAQAGVPKQDDNIKRQRQTNEEETSSKNKKKKTTTSYESEATPNLSSPVSTPSFGKKKKKDPFLGHEYPDDEDNNTKTSKNQAPIRKLGTSLMLTGHSISEELWKSQLHLVAMTDPNNNETKINIEKKRHSSHAARQLEIFLDLVSFLATDKTCFILNPRYQAILTKEDQLMHEFLRKLYNTSQPIVKTSFAWHIIEQYCLEMGAVLCERPGKKGKFICNIADIYILAEQEKEKAKKEQEIQQGEENDDLIPPSPPIYKRETSRLRIDGPQEDEDEDYDNDPTIDNTDIESNRITESSSSSQEQQQQEKKAKKKPSIFHFPFSLHDIKTEMNISGQQPKKILLSKWRKHSNTQGHVFVMHGDIRRVDCDAWLVPSTGIVTHFPFRRWLYPSYMKFTPLRNYEPSKRIPPSDADIVVSPPENTRRTNVVARVTNFPKDRGIPFIVDYSSMDLIHLLEAVQQYFAVVYHYFKNTWQPNPDKRMIPLVILPVVGTGFAGYRGATGSMMHYLLPVLYAAAERFGYDVALVCFDEPTYCSAQTCRLKLEGRVLVNNDPNNEDDLPKRRRNIGLAKHHKIKLNTWSILDDKTIQQAKDIASLSLDGQLALFFSTRQDPTLPQVLLKVAETFGNFSKEEIKALSGLAISTQCKIVQKRLGGLDLLAKAVDDVMRSRTIMLSITSFFLSRIPCKESITMDQGNSFEQCCGSIGKSLRLLPAASKKENIQLPTDLYNGIYTSTDRQYRDSTILSDTASNWLLKLNGNMQNAKVMLTDKLNYSRTSRRKALLASMLQALLITRHMLFVGISPKEDVFMEALGGLNLNMDDEKFHQMNNNNNTTSGAYRCSILSATKNTVAEEFFHPHAQFVTLSKHTEVSPAHQNRLENIFLDCVCAHVADSTLHLLDDRFKGTLLPSEIKLITHLSEMLADSMYNNVWMKYTSFLEMLDSFGVKKFHLTRNNSFFKNMVSKISKVYK